MNDTIREIEDKIYYAGARLPHQSADAQSKFFHDCLLAADRAAREDCVRIIEENFDEDSNAITIAAAIRASIKP